jgi:prepilin peptidase CpaA
MLSSHSLTQWLGLAVFTTALALAALHDVRFYLIPNRFCAAIAASFVLFAAGSLPAAEIGAALAAGVGLFAAGAVLFSRGLLGGGDVKLLAAVALWAPPAHFMEFMLATSLAGALLALLLMTPLRLCLPRPVESESEPVLRQPVPFGVAIAVGGLLAVTWRAGFYF